MTILIFILISNIKPSSFFV